jgi:hypothetical protein
MAPMTTKGDDGDVVDLGSSMPSLPNPIPYPTNTSTSTPPPSLPSATTPFFTQLYWTVHKNLLLLSRRPLMVLLMLSSSLLSVLLSWAAGRDTDTDTDTDTPLPEMDQCNSVPFEFYNELEWNERSSKMKYSLNDRWRNGLPVAVLSLGPFLQAVCAFLVVQSEIEGKLLGVLRTLGVRESVYWISWYLPFLSSSLINSLLGAGLAKILPGVHVFASVYYGGIFASLFFLQAALVASSFFLAAVCGSLKRLIVMIVALMILAVFVPFFVISANFALDSFTYTEPSSAPPGLFWMNRNTSQP